MSKWNTFNFVWIYPEHVSDSSWGTGGLEGGMWIVKFQLSSLNGRPSNCLHFEEISGRSGSVPAMPARLLSFCWNLRPHEAHEAHGCSQCGDAFCHAVQLPMTFSCYSDKWFSFATKVGVESRWVRKTGRCKKMRAVCFEVGFPSRWTPRFSSNVLLGYASKRTNMLHVSVWIVWILENEVWHGSVSI